MKRTQVYIPDDLFAEVKALAQASGKNISQLLRQGLQVVLKEHHKETGSLQDLVGIFKGNDVTTIAQEIDDIYQLPWEDDPSRFTDQPITKIKNKK